MQERDQLEAGGKSFVDPSEKSNGITDLICPLQTMTYSLQSHLSTNSYQEPNVFQSGCWALLWRFCPGRIKENGDLSMFVFYADVLLPCQFLIGFCKKNKKNLTLLDF